MDGRRSFRTCGTTRRTSMLDLEFMRHAFGAGIVVSSAPRPDDEEVTVAFAGKGVKKLMASFAGLTKT